MQGDNFIVDHKLPNSEKLNFSSLAYNFIARQKVVFTAYRKVQTKEFAPTIERDLIRWIHFLSVG